LEDGGESTVGEAEKEGVNFVMVPTMTPHEVVSLLLDRFPAMRDRICPDEDCFDLPTCVYDSFANEVVRRADDPGVFESVIRFIDDIAESKDPLLSNVLVVCVLEGIATDPDVARRVSGAIGETARTLLRDVERNFYHRMNT
jgi:hypothetical protein